jgi:hypothetical protein
MSKHTTASFCSLFSDCRASGAWTPNGVYNYYHFVLETLLYTAVLVHQLNKIPPSSSSDIINFAVPFKTGYSLQIDPATGKQVRVWHFSRQFLELLGLQVPNESAKDGTASASASAEPSELGHSGRRQYQLLNLGGDGGGSAGEHYSYTSDVLYWTKPVKGWPTREELHLMRRMFIPVFACNHCTRICHQARACEVVVCLRANYLFLCVHIFHTMNSRLHHCHLWISSAFYKNRGKGMLLW